ncbi:FMN-binding negative transcriptional regulator [Algoriphagus sp.]|uniref:FMN-binding negative transcriptional regulator n=1 Tax=Algoriphagus sp. TaxID=1872435 RepID=UPI0025FE484D|nr:FMN-binding negative transcriptional regulator [Algoriphagus sp.]
MYIHPLNRWEEESEISEFIQKNSFATLVSTYAGRPWATHLPLMLKRDKNGDPMLSGHVAKANPQWKELRNEVLVIFQGPHAYISSSWYNHENVPTWNYLAVHAYCTIKIIEGEELMDHLKSLVDTFEEGRPNRVSVEKMSEKYLESQVKALVGIELKIKEIHASAKLSQNRDEVNYKNIVKQLGASPFQTEKEIASEMKKRMKKL